MARQSSQEKLRLKEVALRAISQGVVITGADRRIVSVNSAFEAITGFSENDVLGRSCDILQGPLTDPETIVKMRVTLNDGLEFSGEVCNYRKDGENFWNELTITPARDAEGFITHFVGICRDITERVNAREALLEREQQLTTAMASMHQGLAMFDPERKIVVWNSRYPELLRLPDNFLRVGMSLREILNERVRVGSFYGDIETALGREDGALNATSSFSEEDVAADGCVLLAFVRRHEDGGYVVTHEDVTDQRRIEAQIEYDALHDALTGLPNRRLLDRVLAEREAACRASSEGVAVLHVDLDRFKQINDTLGHEAGDAMLIHAASVLKSNLRSTDFVSRVGGDEFVIVCTLGEARTNLAALAIRIVTQMRKPVMYQGHECRFGVSIGIAHQTGEKVSARKLLINADMALYQAKSNGRGCYQFFTPAMQSAATHTKQLSDEIQAGLEGGEFVAYYQPQVDAKTREISGVEALVRWEHPSRGLLSPDKFLKIADDLGVVGTIDRIILEQTLDNFERWNDQGLRVPRASVNVSAKRLRDSNLIKSLKRLAIPPGTISFELLESIYLDEADDVVAWNIDQIRELGIDIEIDDFGTGHTSILSLLKLKPERLKIDRQLVAPIVGSLGQKQLLRTVVEIGHSLGIKVIAEGVETLEHAAIAESLGCDELQGYAFSKPLSGKDFAVFAAESLRANFNGARPSPNVRVK